MSVFPSAEKRKKIFLVAVIFTLTALIGVGAMARQGWLPHTDAVTGKKTGWFGAALPNNASSSWNPLAAPLPTPTPQLSKEYIYAGSKLLAVEDANATAAPPADLAIWRPSNGQWWVMGSTGSTQTTVQWGISTDTPVPGDFDGDGKTDFSVFRETTGRWYIVQSSAGDQTTNEYTFGASGDKPAPADYDGDGKTDAVVFRPSNTTWCINKSSGGVDYIQFGLGTDTPAAADYDGDGKADIAVWRSSNQTFYIKRSSDQSLQTGTLGQSSSTPVSADFDGDGKADMAVRNGANWIIKRSTNGVTDTIPWEQAGDKTVHNDYDGDGKVDIAVWRNSNGNWYIRQSTRVGQSDVLRQVQWGIPDDVPVPAFYRR